ncbi:DotU family type IV/VI secretion system protein [Candidatus Odyssella acanthamoebae]|uniref:DotU family type IV/VI secretion system protein n=1 Tax=Candidatus Odyssella acanthamoebae TaxID=91604 RepID=UPI00068C1EDB|nr:DotU family type IV/VI secretion system protein [Candidatus Paracaedibacter acanthamoebae]
MTIDASAVTKNFLMQNFQEFYRELLIQKEIALRTLEDLPNITSPETAPTVEASLSNEETPQEIKIETITDSIQHTFRIMFERFSLNAQNQVGEFAISHFQDALYAMVALLDETFLSFSWVGKGRWERNLMEKQVFHTQIAGELVFRKIDDLLAGNDPVRNDVANIYMMILSLGFKGKYRDEDTENQITWYRHELYKMINRHAPLLFSVGRDYLIPECYHHIISMPAGRGVPDVRSWVTAFAAILFVFIVVSSFLWFKLVKDMDDALGQILTQAQKLGLS